MIHLLSQLDRIYRGWLSESERITGDQGVLYIRENLIVLFKREYVQLDLDDLDDIVHVGNDPVYRRRAFQSEDEVREGCQRWAFEYDGKADFAEHRQYECQLRLYLKDHSAIIGEALEANNALAKARDAKIEAMEAKYALMIEAQDAKVETLEAKHALIKVLDAKIEAQDVIVEALDAIAGAKKATIKVLDAKIEDLEAKVGLRAVLALDLTNFRMPKEFMNEPLIPNPDHDNEIELNWLEAVKHQYRAGTQFYRGLAVYSLARFPSIIEQGALLASFYETIACERKMKMLEYKKKIYYSFQAHERETYVTEIYAEAAKADKCQAYANWFRHRQEMEALQEVVQEVEEMLAKKEKLAEIKKLANTEIDQPIYLIVLKVVLHYFLPLPSALQDLRAQFSACFPLRE
jgi:hypothetical protein